MAGLRRAIRFLGLATAGLAWASFAATGCGDDDSGRDATGDAEADATTEATTDADADVSVEAETEAGDDADVPAEADAEAGDDVPVEADAEAGADGDAVLLTINRYVMRLEHHEQELVRIASRVPGVKSVTTKVGPHFNQPNIYPKAEFLPTKILLVDDEKEFVETLSERLQTRNLESAIAYDGEQALAILQDDAPEVMVLDLKMPGIDGLEVLRRVKRDHPATEVIILTGHGSPAEAELAKELGAFAYLEKPVNVDVLAETMKAAYRKIGEAK